MTGSGAGRVTDNAGDGKLRSLPAAVSAGIAPPGRDPPNEILRIRFGLRIECR